MECQISNIAQRKQSVGKKEVGTIGFRDTVLEGLMQNSPGYYLDNELLDSQELIKTV